MTESPYRLPKGELTDSGKVLLKMRQGEGVPIKQLSRDFKVSRRIKAARRQKVRWAPRCQVWGAVGVGWRYLVILRNDTSITSETYIETLKQVDFTPNSVFQQDGATAHTARASKEYIENRMSDVLRNWPPQLARPFPNRKRLVYGPRGGRRTNAIGQTFTYPMCT